MPRKQKKKAKKGKNKASGSAAAEAGSLEEPLLPTGSGADDANAAGAATAAVDLEAGGDGAGNDSAAVAAIAASAAAASAPSTPNRAAAAVPKAGSSSSPRRRRGPKPEGTKEDTNNDEETGINADDYDKAEADPEAEALLLPTARPVEAELVLDTTLEDDASTFAERLLDDSMATAEEGVVQIVAPATLPPNYTFVATLPDGRAFTVTVSSDGIDEGEVIEVPFPLPHQFLATTVVPPRGYWKDGLCGCCGYGCCHPVLWLSWCCPLAALGQVNTRLQLSWLSMPAPPRIVRWTFTTLVTITILHLITTTVLCYLGKNVDTTFYRAESIFSLIIVLFRVYAISATRKQVRTKYDIRESSCARGCCCGCCRPCDDCCAALFCSCCAVSQMLRHTADYETFRATCCTGTGLSPNAPVVV